MAVRKQAQPPDEVLVNLWVREAAYYRWQERGSPQGTALDDWLYAEAGMAHPKAMKKIPAARRKKAPAAA
jgi:hypothetical protein